MKAHFLIFALTLLNVFYASGQDTLKTKRHKNTFEIGYTTANFLDGYGYKKPFTGESLSGYIPLYEGPDLSIYYIAYKRELIKNLFLRASFNTYQNIYNYDKLHSQTLEKGNLISKFYNNTQLAAGKSFNIYRFNNKIKLHGTLGLSANYRTGYETIFLIYRSRIESLYDGVNYKSFGIGTFAEANFIFYNRISLGTEFSFGHYFENGRLIVESRTPNSELYKTYRPNKNMMTNHIKLGVLF